MNVYELVEKMGGEIVRGRARIREGREYIVVGQLNGDNMEFTEAGRRLAAGAPAVEDAPVKAKRGRPGKSAVVESAAAESIFNDETTVFDGEQGLT